MINGYKYDFRMYVFVNSIDPLRIYIYKDGLTRFGYQPYQQPSRENMNNILIHLTRRCEFYDDECNNLSKTKRSF